MKRLGRGDVVKRKQVNQVSVRSADGCRTLDIARGLPVVTRLDTEMSLPAFECDRVTRRILRNGRKKVSHAAKVTLPWPRHGRLDDMSDRAAARSWRISLYNIV